MKVKGVLLGDALTGSGEDDVIGSNISESVSKQDANSAECVC